jgi:hypothetical protein
VAATSPAVAAASPARSEGRQRWFELGTRADVRVFAEGRWSLRADSTELHTLHHLGAGVFAWPGEAVRATPLPS